MNYVYSRASVLRLYMSGAIRSAKTSELMNKKSTHPGNAVLAILMALYFASSLIQTSHAEDGAKAIDVANALSTAFEQAAQQIMPSVVNISSVKRVKAQKRDKRSNDPAFEQFRKFFGDDFADRFGPFQDQDQFSQQGLGTGVIIDADGHILTNNHVIGEADEVTVSLTNHQKFKAKVIGTDPRSDLAVIQIKASGLVAAKLGDSDALRTGEWVVAAGNPFGLDNSITAGIVSAKGRSVVGGGQYEDFIQTDAAINPGNSGGPLVNLKGEVVGINSAIYTKSGGYMGIGFAIPIKMAKNVMQSLISKGKVVRGWLGIGIQDLTEDLAQSFNFAGSEGALVGHVEAGGPAQKAGLKQGDIIVRINGEKVRDINHLRNTVAATEPGSSIEIEVVRNGRKESFSVKAGELPAQSSAAIGEEEEQPSVDIGLSLDNITADIARRLGLKSESGVIVKNVQPGSTAARAGLLPRDIIVSIDGKDINSVSDFNAAVTTDSLQKGLRIVVQTSNMERFVFLKEDSEQE